MLDLKYLRQNLEFVRLKMADRGQSIDFDLFLALDTRRRDILMEVETLRSERNNVSKEIGNQEKEEG